MVSSRASCRAITAAVLCAASPARAQLVAADSIAARDRGAFDYLVGEWHMVSRDLNGTVTAGGSDVYRFAKMPGGIGLESSGTSTAVSPASRTSPRRAGISRCYLSYNNATHRWSFYYMSPQSAQYFQATKSDGVWYLTHEFTPNGERLLQRQGWEPMPDGTLRRHIDNSRDNGGTFTPVAVITFRRAG